MVSRETVEAGDLSPALNSLSALVVSRESARHFLGRVDLAVDGYDDDPRELFEVPEVRAYLARAGPGVPLLVSRPVSGG